MCISLCLRGWKEWFDRFVYCIVYGLCIKKDNDNNNKKIMNEMMYEMD